MDDLCPDIIEIILLNIDNLQSMNAFLLINKYSNSFLNNEYINILKTISYISLHYSDQNLSKMHYLGLVIWTNIFLDNLNYNFIQIIRNFKYDRMIYNTELINYLMDKTICIYDKSPPKEGGYIIFTPKRIINNIYKYEYFNLL